jgi:hypothetical protein
MLKTGWRIDRNQSVHLSRPDVVHKSGFPSDADRCSIKLIGRLTADEVAAEK